MKNLENLKLKVDKKGLNSIEALESQRDVLLGALNFALSHINIFVPKKYENPELKELISNAIKNATSC